MYNVVLLQIMYLAEENWRKRGVHADVSFYTGGPAIFASPYYGKVLTRVSSPPPTAKYQSFLAFAFAKRLKADSE